MKSNLPLLLTCLLALALPLQSATREEQWQQVESAIQAGQPQTAIEALQPIIEGALADEAHAEAVKAIARRIILEGNIQGNKPEEKIRLMEAEITAAPDEMKPVLQTLLAHWYWHYFQNNRWRFMQRTATSEPPGEDFTTWDLRRLFAEIDTHFQASLSNEGFLKGTAVAEWDDLLEAGTLPDDHRPTLYDFLAHEALAFYSAGEQVAMQPEEPFEVPADGPIFGTVDAFLNWEPAGPTEGTVAPALRALTLYQALLRFHQEDDNPTAFIDVDIARLVWGSNVAFGETQQARFREALERIVNQWADHPLSAIARFHWAASVRGEDDLVRAREIALRGAEIFPESDGGRMCRNLVTEIEAKSFEVISERVWNEPWPAIRVRYRNLTNLHFRAVPYEWEDFLDSRRNRPRNLGQQERRLVLDRPVAKSWSVTLPSTPDYQERIEKLVAPDDLEAGFYFIVASHDSEFRDTDNQVKFTDVWVSELALIIRPRAGQIEGFLLEADSGRPLPGAEVMAWQLDNQGNRVARPALDTDEHGFFSIREDTNRGWLIRVRHEGRELASEQEYASHWREHDIDRRQTVFFTDRSIYRPGQTIQYKGICLEVDTARDNYQTLAGRAVTVAFVDPNNNEIARREHRCNGFGSFSGSFTAPRDRVTGAMRIYVVNGPQGATHLSVEEYKRPKFEVTLDAPKEAPRLDETVALSGKAMSYTGAPVDGARVRYRVVREVRWPYWWGWHHRWRTRGVSESQEIAHGFTETDVNGAFTIEFQARPDPKVPEEEGVSFSFAVHADVTDTAGETRSDQRRLQAGFVALSARIDAEEWQTPDEPVRVRVSTTTLDGEPQRAEGVIKVHRLEEPQTVHRPYVGEISSYWPGPGPDDPDLSNPEFWPLGEMVAEQGFTTAGNGLATNSFELDVGAYRAVMETRDRFGESLIVRHQLLVVDPAADDLDVKVPHLLTAPKWSVEPGEEFVALWGTGYEEGRAFVEIEHRHQFMTRFRTGAGGTQQRIVVPVTEAMRGGFTVHVTYVRENRAYLERRHVDVPWSNKNLDLRWEHFTSKLEPAVKETWTAVVSGPDADKAAAEMVATLYDASLDAFQPHRWMERFGFFRRDYTTAQPDFQNGTAHFVWMMGRWADRRVTVSRAYRHFPRDLIANIWGYQFLSQRRFGAGTDQLALTEGVLPAAPAAAETMMAADAGARLGMATRGVEMVADGVEKAGEQAPEYRPNLDQITARKNLDETAFFFPQLTSDSNG
ncbi:MAG TPA: MG2 domain-containing protein, partial [Methylomirabilota bacterium]|nr:MG2 domain-containing protein [Methylomirabilota bacterium]